MKLFCFPSNIEEDILAIGARQVPYCRTAEFSSTMKENESWLLDAIGCSGGRVIPLAASGTGAMDAVVSNLVGTVSRVLVIKGGSFGARWESLCHYYGIPCDALDVDFGKGLDMHALACGLDANRYDALLMQHHETSSGQLFDVASVGRLCREKNVLLIVDAISSFLADEYRMDEWDVGITVLSSHKGLCLPPGLGFVVLGADAADRPFGHRGFYFDFQENLANLERGQTPYTPAIPILVQLHERLLRLRAEGLDEHLATVARKADLFRLGLREEGIRLSSEGPSNCMTGFYIKGDAHAAFEALRNRGMIVMPSHHPGLLRVSHVGSLVAEDYTKLLDEVIQWERSNG